MTNCTMIMITVAAVFPATLLLWWAVAALHRAWGKFSFRRLTAALTPAAAAAALVFGLAYGWSSSKPCGGSASLEPGEVHNLARVLCSEHDGDDAVVTSPANRLRQWQAALAEVLL